MRIQIALIAFCLILGSVMSIRVRNHMRARQGDNYTDTTGYYDDDGNWIDTSYDDSGMYNDTSYEDGYYDSDGNWVSYYDSYNDTSYEDGYWDDDGNWVSYDSYNDTSYEDGYWDDDGNWVSYDSYNDTNYDDGYWDSDGNWVSYDTYNDTSYEDGHWDEDGNWISYDNHTDTAGCDEYGCWDENGYYPYDDVHEDGWEEEAQWIEDLIYEARQKLDDAIWVWENHFDGSWNHSDHHHENHTEWHCPDSCPWGMFEGQTIEDLTPFFEEQTENAGEPDEWGNTYWYFEEGDEWAEGGSWDWTEYHNGQQWHGGWGWDGSSSVYWEENQDGDRSIEIYDCDWNLVESIHAAHDTVDYHPDDNEAMVHGKGVYNEGNHYYWGDGAVEFWSSDYNTWGEVYPDGYIYAWYDPSGNWEEEHVVEAECFGASGIWTHSGYDDDGNWVEFSHEEWDHGCEEYTNYMEFQGDADDAWDATEDVAANDALLEVANRAQIRAKIRAHRR